MTAPQEQDLLATLAFNPACTNPNHDPAKESEARWGVWPKPCCGPRVWLFCDSCLFDLFKPGSRIAMSTHGHYPACRGVRLIQGLTR